MDIYSNKNLLKGIFLVFAMLIGVGTIFYTESFLHDLRGEEVKRVKLWAAATEHVNKSTNDDELGFVSQVIMQNNTIPIIVTNEKGEIVLHRNLNSKLVDKEGYLEKELEEMASQFEPIVIEYGLDHKSFIYYKESILLTQLRMYPIILLTVIALFIGIAYLAFSNSRKSEQNRVWNGMAKETAHQIGTPLSSLMGWIEILRTQNADETALVEMEKDIVRLETITDRFSKIGSVPQMSEESLSIVVQESVDYLRSRVSKKIQLTYRSNTPEDTKVSMNKQLFGWVLENLVRNAMDAIQGAGTIDIELITQDKWFKIDVKDSGKGIAISQQKAVFRPGFTSKSRGWGLGLSLAKRIIGDYHRGKIYVAQSELGKGTTFRILLPKKLV